MNMSVSIPQYSMEFPRHQRFSLPHPIILYLLETESPHLLLKLQQRCKYFFAKKKILVVTEEISDLNTYDLSLISTTRYWITKLNCWRRNGYSYLRPLIYRATLSKLCVRYQNLSLNDINFLLNKKMQKLTFYKVNIRDATGNPVPIDYILRKIPEVAEFRYDNLCEIYSNQSLSKLNSINLKNKLRYLFIKITQTSEELDAESLGKFVQSILASDGQVQLLFPRNAPEIRTVLAEVQRVVKYWQSPGAGPNFYVGAC